MIKLQYKKKRPTITQNERTIVGRYDKKIMPGANMHPVLCSFWRPLCCLICWQSCWRRWCRHLSCRCSHCCSCQCPLCVCCVSVVPVFAVLALIVLVSIVHCAGIHALHWHLSSGCGICQVGVVFVCVGLVLGGCALCPKK